MIKTKLRCVVALTMVPAPLPRLAVQVQTDVPPPVPNATTSYRSSARISVLSQAAGRRVKSSLLQSTALETIRVLRVSLSLVLGMLGICAQRAPSPWECLAGRGHGRGHRPFLNPADHRA